MGLSLALPECRWSSSSDGSAATTSHDGDSMISLAEKLQDGDKGFAQPFAECSDDNESDVDLNSEEEELYNLGEDLWIHEKYLAYLEKPKDIDILLFRHGEPDKYEWMAVAPEWNSALGFGSTKEEASEDLESKLLDTKLSMIEDKNADYIKKIPIEPCRQDAEKECRRGVWLAFFEELKETSSAWGWGKIQA